MKLKKVIPYLISTNDPQYQIIKVCEELNELSTALLQYHLKGGMKTTDQDVIDEIGDVKIRLKILESMFDKRKIKQRVKDKLVKFKGYILDNKYQTRI